MAKMEVRQSALTRIGYLASSLTIGVSDLLAGKLISPSLNVQSEPGVVKADNVLLKEWMADQSGDLWWQRHVVPNFDALRAEILSGNEEPLRHNTFLIHAPVCRGRG